MDTKEKNPAAVALGSLGGKARARNLTPKQLSKIGKLAAVGRNKALTAKQRKDIAQKASNARWSREIVTGLERPEV